MSPEIPTKRAKHDWYSVFNNAKGTGEIFLENHNLLLSEIVYCNEFSCVKANSYNWFTYCSRTSHFGRSIVNAIFLSIAPFIEGNTSASVSTHEWRQNIALCHLNKRTVIISSKVIRERAMPGKLNARYFYTATFMYNIKQLLKYYSLQLATFVQQIFTLLS